MNRVHDWTEARRRLLAVLWTGQVPLKTIGRRLGIDPKVCWYQARVALRLPARKAWSPPGCKRFPMAEHSKIAWTDGTFNPWIGCTRVSPGCENCYAENQMDRRYKRVKWGPGQPRSRTKTWNDPLKWNREAERLGIRKRVFCASLADYLDEEVPAQWREDLFDLIDSCRWIDWLMLTKRPENASAMLPPDWWKNPRPHVWHGVTAENQVWWNNRVTMLKAIPAALRWVSYEPALGPIDMSKTGTQGISWVIIGGESAQMKPAREFRLEWARSMLLQCRQTGVVPFMKQTGTFVTLLASQIYVTDKAGADPLEWPPWLRVREFPPSPATKAWAEGSVGAAPR